MEILVVGPTIQKLPTVLEVKPRETNSSWRKTCTRKSLRVTEPRKAPSFPHTRAECNYTKNHHCNKHVNSYSNFMGEERRQQAHRRVDSFRRAPPHGAERGGPRGSRRHTIGPGGTAVGPGAGRERAGPGGYPAASRHGGRSRAAASLGEGRAEAAAGPRGGGGKATLPARDVGRGAAAGTHSGGKSRSSSIFPRKPKSVRICSELALGETLVTWITSVPLLEAIAPPPARLLQTHQGEEERVKPEQPPAAPPPPSLGPDPAPPRPHRRPPHQPARAAVSHNASRPRPAQAHAGSPRGARAQRPRLRTRVAPAPPGSARGRRVRGQSSPPLHPPQVPRGFPPTLAHASYLLRARGSRRSCAEWERLLAGTARGAGGRYRLPQGLTGERWARTIRGPQAALCTSCTRARPAGGRGSRALGFSGGLS